MIKEQNIRKYLREPISVKVFEVTDSTNNDARALGETSDFSETLFVAKRQISGRGQAGRSFFSPNGGLYMSLLLKPDFDPETAAHITTAAAVSVSRAVFKVANIECGIKWVNDLYYEGKKVCGILTETRLGTNNKFDFAVLGIGLNLTYPDKGFPAEIVNTAGALFKKLPEDADNLLAAEIVNEFYALYRNRLNKEDYINEYRSRSCILGKEVDIICLQSGESRVGIAEEIDDECRLIVKYPDGSREVLISGQVTMALCQ